MERTGPYEIYAIDPNDNETLLEECETREEAIRAWIQHDIANRNSTTVSVEIWRDGERVNER